MATYDLDLAAVSALFKTKYGKLSEATFNTMFPTLSRITKKKTFTGSDYKFPIPLSFGGSVGSGSLPTAHTAQWSTATLTRKKVYARLKIDRETIKAAADDAGAFVRGTKEFVRTTVESFTRNLSRILFNNGTGSLGTIDTVSASGAVYTCVITAATWKEANWEERDYVNVEAGNTDLFEVTSVTPSTRTVVLTRATGSQVPATTDVVYMQGSENNDPEGLKGVCDATSSTKYGITIARRFQSHQIAAASAPITSDLLNEAVLELYRKTGKNPTMIVASFKQYRKILNFLEDAKSYQVRPKDKRFEGLVSFGGVEYLSDSGTIPIYPERFVEDDRIYFLNENYIELHTTPSGIEWFDDDGTVLLRTADTDEYEARYGMYGQIFINPAFQAVITGLA
jgi:hypothetical protein